MNRKSKAAPIREPAHSLAQFPFAVEHPLVKQLAAGIAESACWLPVGPSAAVVCHLLNVAFWASMQSEEGHLVRTSLAIFDPERHLPLGALRFQTPISLSSGAIAKLSTSFPYRPGAIGVKFSSERAAVLWGIVLPKPEHALTLEILGPGYIVLRDSYVRAVVQPDGSITILHELQHPVSEWCDLLFNNADQTCLGRPIPLGHRLGFYGLLHVLARAMVGHHHGGTVILVSPENDSWKRTVDFTFEFHSPQAFLTELHTKFMRWQARWSRKQDRLKQDRGETDFSPRFLPDSKQERALHAALELVGGLTAVDGTLVMNTRLEVLGYGAKVKAPARDVQVRERFPFGDHVEVTKSLADLGGTRHRSAALFAIEHADTLVLVASQDGRFTIFCADDSATEVIALRAEALLL